ncbi:hypothetical protein [Mesorhizobium sp. B263B2A]|uniref:hypothetical protein n=1 Tax=Mesorhizobium sp. B263B2A TaxID=2876669 RepID=UPI001CD16A56|nr:hypothetical protein [Mesorhizobium sp. B263B2A]MCA0029589.1 hypothetical protein [Mesorhizobium sp. B263B2A]
MSSNPEWIVSNKLIDLAELNIDRKVVEASISEETDIILDLRFGLGTIDINGQEIDIGFKCAELYLILDGVEITPGSRFGDHQVEAVITDTLKESTKLSASKATATKAGFTLDPTALLASASHEESGASNMEHAVARDLTRTEYRISARPNGLWFLEGPKGGPLVNTYLSGSLLCKVRPLEKSNRRGAKIVLLSRKNHIYFSPPDSGSGILSKLSRGNTNLDRVFSALLAKSVGNESYEKKSGYIEISVIGNHEL